MGTTSFNGQFIAVTVSMLVFDSSAAWFVVGTMTDKLLQTIDLRDRSEYTHRMEHMQRISERGISDPPEQVKAKKGRIRIVSSPEDSPPPFPVDIEIQEQNGDAIPVANSSHSFSVKRMSQQRDIRRLQLDLAYSCFTADDRKRLDLITKLFLLSISSIITSQICYLSLVIA